MLRVATTERYNFELPNLSALRFPYCREQHSMDRYQGTKIQPKVFLTEVFGNPLGSWTSVPSGHGYPRRNACSFSRILTALTEVLGRDIRANDPWMSAGCPSQELPLWADFSFLKTRTFRAIWELLVHMNFGGIRMDQWPHSPYLFSGKFVWTNGADSSSKSEQIEWRHLFYRGTPKSSKNNKRIL